MAGVYISEPASTFEQERQYLLGSGPNPSNLGSAPDGGSSLGAQQQAGEVPLASGGGGGSSSSASGAPSISSAPSTGLSAGAAASSAAMAPSPGGGTSNKGSVEDRLLSPLTTGLSSTGASLTQGIDDFYNNAGASRSFEGVGGEGVLSGALGAFDDSAAQVAAMNDAQGLAGASYTGPGGLDEQTLSDAYFQLGGLQDRAEALRTGGGIKSLLQQALPGITPGEAAAESRRLQDSTAFQTRRAAGEREVGRLRSLADREGLAASTYATQRGDEERSIAQASQDYLNAQRADVTGAIDAQMAERTASQANVEQAYRGLLESGSLSALDGVAEGGLTFDPNLMRTDAQAGLRDADRVRAEIMAKYEDIADVDLLTPHIARHGRSRINQLSAQWDEDNPNATPQEREVVRKRAIERQRELDAQFSPGAEGKFDLYNPSQYGTRVQLPDVRGYSSFDPGTSPSRGNVSTEDQKRIYNRINEIVGSLDRIVETGESFRAAKISADVEAFLENEILTLENQDSKLTNNKNQWLSLARRARKKFKDMRSKKKWAKIGGYAELGTGVIFENASASFMG